MSGINEFNQLEENTLEDELIKYIERELPNFKPSDEFANILVKKKNENQHSTALTVFMTNQCHAKFNFQRENAQKGSSTVDIGVYKGSILLFTIEAKILPTPLTDSDRKEYEYVFGKGGGIERFKNRDHGLDNNYENLSQNGMIAYIKQNTFEYWHKKVNTWIDEAQWNQSEKLQKIYFDKIGRLESTHPRIDNSEVKLHHFWVYVQ